MSAELALFWGGKPLRYSPIPSAQVVLPPTSPPGTDPAAALEAALDAPIASPRLEELAPAGARVLVVLSDHTRSDPRAAFAVAVRRRLPGRDVRFAIATGTHGPTDLSRLGVDFGATPVLNHDGHDRTELVSVGRSRRGTEFQVHRALLECDVAVATGVIRPHFFAGYGGGIKALFPGLGGAVEIRDNHRLRTEERARAGVAIGNPCRDDLEELRPLLPCAAFLLNTVVGPDGSVQGAVAGDPVMAFRDGAARADALYRVPRPHPVRVALVSDRLPVTGSLYQACKLIGNVAPLVEDGGAMIVVAACPDGIGPVDTVNHAIYELGVRPRFRGAHRVVLVSQLAPDEVAKTFCEHAVSIDAAQAEVGAAELVVPQASAVLFGAPT